MRYKLFIRAPQSHGHVDVLQSRIFTSREQAERAAAKLRALNILPEGSEVSVIWC